MNKFLTSTSNAKGAGFGMFSLAHMSALIILTFISFFIIRHYLSIDDQKRKKMKKGLAILIVGLEIIRNIILLVTGQFTLSDLPLQLCGIGIFIILYDAFFSNKTSHELLYSLTLPGAIMALITPDWVQNEIINLFVWHSFIMHAFLVTYVLMQLIAKEFSPNWQELWRVVIFLLIIVPPIWFLNRLWHQNFFFLEIPVAGSPLAPIHTIFGQYYILGMILLVLIFWFLMYLPWKIFALKKYRKITQ